MDAKWCLDNPIFVKHARSRLRIPTLFPMVLILLVFSLFVVYLASVAPDIGNLFREESRYQNAYYFFLWSQGIILLLGVAQVASTVGHARESGILDFHRISPLNTKIVVLGFVTGSPIRELFLFSLLQPFSLYCAYRGGYGIFPALTIAISFLMSFLFFSALALVLVVGGKRSRAGTVATLLCLSVYLMGLVRGQSNFFSYLTAGPVIKTLGLNATEPTQLFYSFPLPKFLVCLLHQIPLALCLLFAAERRFRSENKHIFSQLSAIIFYGIICIVVIGTGGETSEISALTILNVLFYVALGLILSFTPQLSQFVSGLRRAKRQGKTGAHILGDSSIPVVGLVALGILHLVVVVFFSQDYLKSAPESAPVIVSFLVIPLCLVAFGLATQYFRLRWGRQSTPNYLLFLFFTWVVPLMLSYGLSSANSSQVIVELVVSVSPFVASNLYFGKATNLTLVGIVAIATQSLWILLFGLGLYQRSRFLGKTTQD